MQLDAPMNWFFLAALFLFGLVFGSFGNVVIWRLPCGESLSHPGSHCPRCDTPIAWYDNVPILGWLLLRGVCRNCHEPISARYPIVELLSGILWVAAGVRFGFSLATVAAIVLFYLLMLLSFIDWDTMRLPNSLVGLLAVLGLGGAAAAQVTGLTIVPLLPQGTGVLSAPLVGALVGAIASAGVVLAIALIYSAVRKTQGFGTGDVKLLAALGLYLGLYGLMAMFLGTVIGAVYGVVSAQRAGESLRHKFAFGPFLAIGAVLTALFGQALWLWYIGLVG